MKHLLLTASLLLLASNMFAQLFVRPNPSTNTDSYLYANDVVLFVEQDVELVENDEEETQASIYLRGDSQLIQGASASLNAGNGSLSVWQRGWGNSYDYNYWGSPVGNPAGGAGNTTFGITRIFDVQHDNVNLEKTHSLPQVSTGSLNGVPSAVGQTTTSLRVSQRWIYTLGESGYANWNYIGNSTNIPAGTGFTMRGTGDASYGSYFEDAHDQLYDFRGRPNNGTISFTGVQAGGKEALLGNPYPSTIDLTAFLLHNVNKIQGTIWFWDQDRTTNSHYLNQIQGGYGSWVPAGGSSVPAEYGGGVTGEFTPATYIMYTGAGDPIPGPSYGNGADYDDSTRFAAIGQGFMVRGDQGGTVEFTNDMRVFVPQSTSFVQFKNTVDPETIDFDNQTKNNGFGPLRTVRFLVEINELYGREMVLMFSPNTTKGEDWGYDGKHPLLVNSGDSFWALEGEEDPFVIQTRPFNIDDKIPFGIKTKNGQTKFNIKIKERFGVNIDMWLVDRLNRTFQLIDEENGANISVNGSATQIDNRFFIVFKDRTRTIEEEKETKDLIVSNVDFFQNNKAKQLEVYNPDVIDIKSAFVYDMTGKTVIQENNLGKQNKYAFNTANLSSGVYLVKLITAEDDVIDYKVTVHNK